MTLTARVVGRGFAPDTFVVELRSSVLGNVQHLTAHYILTTKSRRERYITIMSEDLYRESLMDELRKNPIKVRELKFAEYDDESYISILIDTEE